MSATGCQFRDILSQREFDEVIEDENSCRYILDIIWEDLDEEPTGMTVLFYPSNGGMPYIRLSNEVYHYEVILPEDDYKVLVFNQSEDEFSYLTFVGLYSWDTAEILANIKNDENKSRIDRLYDLPNASQAPQRKGNDNSRAKMNTTQLHARTVSVGRSTDSNSSSTTSVTNSTRAKMNSTQLHATGTIHRMNVSVRVQGLSCNPASGFTPIVTAVNGALTGLAEGYFMGTNQLQGGSLCQELDDWEIISSPSASGIGSVNCSFGVFGVSPSVSSINKAPSRAATMMNAETYVESTDEDDTENILYLNFRLSDGTYVPYRFNVTDRIREQMEEDFIELTLDIGITLDNTDLDDPLILPQTGLPYGGLHISVQGWGEAEEEVIRLN